jgi:hypothetical protein
MTLSGSTGMLETVIDCVSQRMRVVEGTGLI